MTDIEKAIEEMESCLEVIIGHGEVEIANCYELAIEALQEKAKREKGCEYCDFSSGDVGGTFPSEDSFCLINSSDEVSIATDEFGIFRMANIKYCPMCGRKLVQE